MTLLRATMDAADAGCTAFGRVLTVHTASRVPGTARSHAS